MARLINQQDNYLANFGATFRSSAIFYKPVGIKTTISFCNYWDFKNNLSVGLVSTVRKKSGELVSRKELKFSAGKVINLEVFEIDEGSIEVEAFSSSNLRIPYAAIMAVYETKNSISMVHSYSRNHSLIELEDDKAILEGRESCWTIRTGNSVKNTAVFHNGHVPLNKQKGLLTVTTKEGRDFRYEVPIPALKPFETLLFCIEDIVPNISEVLNGEIGWASIHFDSQSSFTRLLVSWEDRKTNQFQVTHSNFDFTSHITNQITSDKSAYMVLPLIKGRLPSIIVYPKFSPGVYSLSTGNIYGDESNSVDFESGIALNPDSNVVKFRRKDGELPARIVTAVSGQLDKTSLPFECSLGVVHEQRPPKRFHWFLVSNKFPTTVHITSYEEVYESTSQSIELVFRLYISNSQKVAEKIVSFDSLLDVPSEIELGLLFNEQIGKTRSAFSYVSMFSTYGGFFVYSSLMKESSMTLEHSF